MKPLSQPPSSRAAALSPWVAALAGAAVTLLLVGLVAGVPWGPSAPVAVGDGSNSPPIDFTGIGAGGAPSPDNPVARRDGVIATPASVEPQTAAPQEPPPRRPQTEPEPPTAAKPPQRDESIEADAEAMQAEAEAKASARQTAAYESLRSLATHAILPPPSDDGLDGGSQGNAPIDLGPFPVADLIDPTFALAVPRDEVDGKPFVAQVRRPDAAKPEWLIEFVPHAVEGEMAGSMEPSKPRPLAKLSVADGRLAVALTDSPANNRRQSLLRRCVVLVSATRPSGGSAADGGDPPAPRDPPHEIRFVMPTRVGTLRVDTFGEPATLDVKPPPGISCAANGVTSILPTASCEVKAKFVSREVSRRLPPAPGGDDKDRVIEERIPLAGLGEGADLVLDVAVLPREAQLRITPRVDGPNAGRFPPLADIEERFCKDPEAKREKAKKAWTGRVMNNPGMQPGAPKGMNDRDLTRLFATPLTMGIVVPGHETIEKSLDLFLQHEYREAEERLKQRREAGEKNVPNDPHEPASFQEWVRRDLLDDKDPGHWKQNFQDTVVRWWAWFVPQFDAEWNRLSGNAAAELKAARDAECRIESITSLAYDAAGHEYAVPLVEFGQAPPPAASNDEAAAAPQERDLE